MNVHLLLPVSFSRYRQTTCFLLVPNCSSQCLCLECFGGSDSNSDESLPVENLDDWQVHLAASESDLPECNDKTNGEKLYYVESDAGFRLWESSG